MTTPMNPPPMGDVNALVELMKLVADKDAADAYLAQLQSVSQGIYDGLRSQAENATALSAHETALNQREVDLGAREAGIAQREAALRDKENAVAAKIALFKNLMLD